MGALFYAIGNLLGRGNIDPRLPITGISYFDVQEYISWRRKRDGIKVAASQ